MGLVFFTLLSLAASEATTPRWLGVVVPERRVDLKMPVEGEVVRFLFDEGARVPKDAAVAVVDAPQAREELAMAQAALKAARSELKQRTIDARASRDRARRRQSLVKSGAISQEELSSARYAADAAAAAVESAQAGVREKESRVKQLQEVLTRSELRAPFAGALSARLVEPGTMVKAATAVVRLIADDTFKVRFALPERGAHDLVKGQRLQVTLQDGRGSLDAEVVSVAPEVDGASGMRFAEATLDLPAEKRELLTSGALTWVSPQSGAR